MKKIAFFIFAATVLINPTLTYADNSQINITTGTTIKIKTGGQVTAQYHGPLSSSNFPAKIPENTMVTLALKPISEGDIAQVVYYLTDQKFCSIFYYCTEQSRPASQNPCQKPAIGLTGACRIQDSIIVIPNSSVPSPPIGS